MPKFLRPYKKTVFALIFGLASWGAVAGMDGAYTQNELWSLLLAVGNALGVFQFENETTPSQNG